MKSQSEYCFKNLFHLFFLKELVDEIVSPISTIFKLTYNYDNFQKGVIRHPESLNFILSKVVEKIKRI